VFLKMRRALLCCYCAGVTRYEKVTSTLTFGLSVGPTRARLAFFFSFLLFRLFLFPDPQSMQVKNALTHEVDGSPKLIIRQRVRLWGCAGCGSNSNERIGRMKGESGAIVERERGE